MAIFGGAKPHVVMPVLASIGLLKDVPRRALKAAGKHARWFSVPAGSPLFQAGEEANAIYFVLSGSLGIFRPARNGQSEFSGHVRAGEPVGEMAMLQGSVDIDDDGALNSTHHRSSAWALRDSEILEISRQGFTRLTDAEPDILNAMIRLILTRLNTCDRTVQEASPKVFALIGTSPAIDLDLRAASLQESLARIGVKSRIVHESEGADKPSGFFCDLETGHDILILSASMGDTAWCRQIMRQADRIWIVARADARPSYPLFSENSSPALALKLVDVVLLDYNCGRDVSRPDEWLHASGGMRLFNWRRVEGPDCDRLARTMAGRSVGVVFSGGGARAYAHIGVVKAMRALGIPIDFVGGTSMGAIVAACVAMGWDDDAIDKHMRAGFATSNPLGDWTLPVVGLVKGNRVNSRLRKYFGETEISDLDIPFFAVSTNLTRGTCQVHRQGSLYRALRATISLPGILPPVVNNGDILVDGAVLNNFPVDVMREFHRGLVVGCDVAVTSEGLDANDFIHPPHFFQWVVENGLTSMPPIAELLMRSATVSANVNADRERTDKLILPDLKAIRLHDWKAYDRVVEAGYHAAMAVLQDNCSS